MDAANNASLAESVRVDDDGDFTDITNGVRVEARLPRDMQPDDDATIAWWVVAQDKAGNLVVSDADTADNNDCDAAEFPPIGTDGALIIENNVDDAEELNGEPVLNDERVGNDGSTRVPQCQPFTVNVDFTDPALSSAMTGAFWDDDSEDDDKTNGDTSKGKRTSVMVTFSEALDGSSVRASDFEVDGVQPLDADHYADAGEKVFLTVAEFAPNHRPDVDLVGPVEDLAGNVVNSGGVEDAADGVAPTLTVTVEGVANGDRPVTDGDVTVKISTDENTGNPTVVVRRVSYEALNERVEVTPVTTPATFMDEAKLDDNSDAVMDSVLLEAGAENETATLTSTRNFEVTINLDDDGLYNVNVFATDNSGNTGIAGTALAGREALADATATVATLETIVDVSGDTSAMLVEVDTAGPEATLDPPVSDNPNAFIEIDFAEEAAEYDPDKDYDTHSMVTIVSAMLDGMDIADDMERLGNGSFLYAALGLAVGEYDIVVEAEDTVGNDQETTLTLTIEERAPFELNIRAGVSLISFPGDPEDGDINAVFPAGHPVQRVLTYDPTQPGRWFSARRGDDGMLTGTLMSIRAGAYLVEAASTEPIHVQIERPEFQLPPSLDLVAGWNLVPIIDTSFQLDQGDPIALGNYFSNGLDVISRIYGINPVSKQLESVTLVGLSQVRVGSGYWVFADEAVSIAP